MSKMRNEDVAKAILLSDIDNKGEEIPFSFERFKNILLANDLCVDVRTMKARWDVFLSKGIIRQIGATSYCKGVLDIREFCDEFGFTVDTSVATQNTHTHTCDTQNTHDAHIKHIKHTCDTHVAQVNEEGAQ